MDQIMKKYEALINDFPAQLLEKTNENFYTDEENILVIYNIDFLLLKKYVNLHLQPTLLTQTI